MVRATTVERLCWCLRTGPKHEGDDRNGDLSRGELDVGDIDQCFDAEAVSGELISPKQQNLDDSVML